MSLLILYVELFLVFYLYLLVLVKIEIIPSWYSEFSSKSMSIFILVTVLVFGLSGHTLSGSLDGRLNYGSGCQGCSLFLSYTCLLGIASIFWVINWLGTWNFVLSRVTFWSVSLFGDLLADTKVSATGCGCLHYPRSASRPTTLKLTSSGQDEFKFGRSTPRPAGRSTPVVLTSSGQDEFKFGRSTPFSTMPSREMCNIMSMGYPISRNHFTYGHSLSLSLSLSHLMQIISVFSPFHIWT